MLAYDQTTSIQTALDMLPVTIGQAAFNRLPMGQKLEFLKQRATLLSARVKKGFVILLYGLDDYYVELWQRYDTRICEVRAVMSFSSEAGLLPYKRIRQTTKGTYILRSYGGRQERVG